MGRIVYAFPGTGKTFLCSKNKNYIELASEKYRWLDATNDENNKGLYHIENSEWPNNYLEAIKYYKDRYDIVFITHSGSVLCKENNIHYDLIYPGVSCKDEYLSRMEKRGNNKEFIENMRLHFEDYIRSMNADDYPDEKIVLGSGEYLEDGIEKLQRLFRSPLLDRFTSNEQLITPISNINIHKNKTKEIIEDNNVNYALITFNSQYNDAIIDSGVGKEIGRFYSGSDYKKIVLINGFIVVSSFLGGPNASALMEELAYYGIKNYLAVGTACDIDSGGYNCMLVERAIRDEGTSLFYKDPSVYGYTSDSLNSLVIRELIRKNIEFYRGTTWTVDAYYRENIERMKKRISQGASCIDMESSIWCSVAEQLNLKFSQLLFFTDKAINGSWAKKVHSSDIKDDISELGIEISGGIVKKIGGFNEH